MNILSIFKCAAFFCHSKFKFPQFNDSFPNFRTSGLYVDKSHFIQEVLRGGNNAPFITRPRRWGKSMNLSMLECFFQPNGWDTQLLLGKKPSTLQSQYRSLFVGGGDQNLSPLKISTLVDELNDDIVEKYLGRHPVIRLDFSPLYTEYEGGKQKFKLNYERMLIKTYQNHRYLYLQILLDQAQIGCKQWEEETQAQWRQKNWLINNTINKEALCKDYINNYDNLIKDLELLTFQGKQFPNKFIEQLYQNFTGTFSDNIVYDLTILIKQLYWYFGQNVIILIDEYDNPTQNYLLEELKQIKRQKEIKSFRESHNFIVNQMMNSFLKSDSSKEVELCVVIGINNVFLQEDSGNNNIIKYPVTKVEMSTSFAFTDSEINKLIKDFIHMSEYPEFQMASITNQIKQNLIDWYKGYQIGGTNLYCPYSVMHYLQIIYHCDISQNQIPKPISFWPGSGTNILLTELGNQRFHLNIFQNLSELTLQGKVQLVDQGNDTYPRNVEDLLVSQDLMRYLLVSSGYITPVQGEPDFYKIPNKEISLTLKKTLAITCLQYQLNSLNQGDTEQLVKKFFNCLGKTQELEDLINSEILPQYKAVYSEAKFYSIIDQFFNFSSFFLKDDPQYLTLIEYPGAFQKKIDHVLFPLELKPIILVEYKKTNSISLVQEKEEEALWQIYENCYLYKILQEWKSSYQDKTNTIIVYTFVFYNDSQNNWKVKIKQFQHSIKQARQITNLFLNKTKSGIKVQPRAIVLEQQNVANIKQLINKFAEKKEKN